jgi:hypothetical protein
MLAPTTLFSFGGTSPPTSARYASNVRAASSQRPASSELFASMSVAAGRRFRADAWRNAARASSYCRLL